MTSLTDRAEQALLGALLRDANRIDSARFVTADDFASPQHQAIYNAIIAVIADQLHEDGQPGYLMLAVASREPRFSLGHLHALGRACPHPAHAAAYAEMVLEASLGRRLAAHATRLTHDADALAQELPQLTGPGLAGQGVERSAAHLRNLADAMSAHAREFDVGSSVEGAQPNVPKASGAVPAGPAEQRRIRQEEDVLAGLIQHVWSNGKVLTWLPPEAFAPGARREIYQAIRTLVFNREAVDDLTVQWQLARTSALTQAASTPIRADIRPQPPLHYAADLAARNVEDGSVMLAGRLLLHDYSSARAQTGTAAAPRGGQPAAVVRPRRAPQPAPLPDVSHTPGPPSPRPGGPSRQPGPEPRA